MREKGLDAELHTDAPNPAPTNAPEAEVTLENNHDTAQACAETSDPAADMAEVADLTAGADAEMEVENEEAAAEEAAEAAKADAEAIPSRDGDSGEEVAADDADTKKSVRSSRSRRSSSAKKETTKKETKKKQPKASKPKAAKSSSSSAVRSVRRRK